VESSGWLQKLHRKQWRWYQPEAAIIFSAAKTFPEHLHEEIS
jgi:hypothetical protein